MAKDNPELKYNCLVALSLILYLQSRPWAREAPAAGAASRQSLLPRHSPIGSGPPQLLAASLVSYVCRQAVTSQR